MLLKVTSTDTGEFFDAGELSNLWPALLTAHQQGEMPHGEYVVTTEDEDNEIADLTVSDQGLTWRPYDTHPMKQLAASEVA